MGVIYKNVEEKEVYSAYGMTVYGKVNKYEWSIYPDREDEECLTSLRIADKNGKSLYNRNLGNRCIFKDNFDKTIDNVLYWIDRDCPDMVDIENVVEDNLCASGSIFNYRITNRKLREKNEEDRAKKYAEIQKIREENANKVLELCNKKNLFCRIYEDDCIVLKPLNGKAKEVLESTADPHTMEMYKNFALKNPGNKDVEFVFNGNIDGFLNQFYK